MMLGLISVSVGAHSELLFKESFDNQTDWTADDYVNTGALPADWFVFRVDELWSPRTGYPNKHPSAEILSVNSDKARGGAGKSYVAWRESYDPGWKKYNSDATLVKYFPKGVDSIYVSFYVRFGESWTPKSASKLFRVMSWDDTSPKLELFQFFKGGNSGPIFLWDYSSDDYGVRNFQAYRGGPHGENYSFSNSDISGLPRQMINLGDISLNFTENTVGMGENGQNPKIVDQINGGYISDNLNQTVTHEQVYGRTKNWTKVAFYAKMNTEIGKADGELIQWINDEIIFQNKNIPWVRENSENKMVKWNTVGIGGNDFFRTYANEDQHEEWYAIDDVVIRTDIPPAEKAPNPPSDFLVN